MEIKNIKEVIKYLKDTTKSLDKIIEGKTNIEDALEQELPYLHNRLLDITKFLEGK